MRRVRLQAATGGASAASALPVRLRSARTLTAMQGSTTATCPGIEASPGVVDSAFEGGELSLSWLAVRLGRSVCKACSLGVISAGPVGWALRFRGKPAAACRLRSFC